MTRLELRGKLAEQLRRSEGILAMWEAGSAAFDRADEYSDLDIGLLVKSGTLDEAWSAVDAALNSIGGFDLRWENPQHIFKGMTQRVYHPRDASRWLQLDVGIFEETADDLYLQPQRHGRAEVMFDRSGRVKPPPWDDAKHQLEMREALHQEIMKFNAYRGFFRKELARGRNIDAFGFYLGLSLRPLLSVLGMMHRPDRWDYGFRYVNEELPPDIVQKLERVCYIPAPAALEERFIEMEKMFDHAVAALVGRGLMPIDVKGVDVPGPGAGSRE